MSELRDVWPTPASVTEVTLRIAKGDEVVRVFFDGEELPTEDACAYVYGFSLSLTRAMQALGDAE